MGSCGVRKGVRVSGLEFQALLASSSGLAAAWGHSGESARHSRQLTSALSWRAPVLARVSGSAISAVWRSWAKSLCVLLGWRGRMGSASLRGAVGARTARRVTRRHLGILGQTVGSSVSAMRGLRPSVRGGRIVRVVRLSSRLRALARSLRGSGAWHSALLRPRALLATRWLARWARHSWARALVTWAASWVWTWSARS
jgi:hypothetical protein